MSNERACKRSFTTRRKWLLFTGQLSLFLCPVLVDAQRVTPPAQPLTGPGGATYAYFSYTQSGPYHVDPLHPTPALSYYLFEPTGAPATLPVALFLHGYLLPDEGYPKGDSPENYIQWISHIVRNGYTVVFPIYDYEAVPSQFAPNIISSLQSALVLLQSGSPGLVSPLIDTRGVQTVFTGHSMGAYEALAVAQELTLSPVSGVPVPRAIAAFEPEPAKTGLSTDFSHISPGIDVVIVDADQDPNAITNDTAIWNSITPVIPSLNRDFLEVVTDSHGVPNQIGNHWYPDTNGLNDDDTGVDDRDYNVTWKLSVGLFNCALTGTDCSFGLGHGDFDQLNMGNWSDGTPVTPLQFQP